SGATASRPFLTTRWCTFETPASGHELCSTLDYQPETSAIEPLRRGTKGRSSMPLREKLDDIFFGLEMVGRGAAEWMTTEAVFNPWRKELRAAPYPFYHRLRAKDPIHRSYPASGWVLTRYDDILTVLSDRAFSSDERHWRRYPRERARNARAGFPDMYE